MELKEYRELLFKIALERGCEAAQTRFDGGDAFSVDVLNGDIDKYVSSRDRSLTLRVKFEGHDGYASTEVFEDAEALVERAMDNARTIEIEDETPWQGKAEYRKVEEDHDYLYELSDEEKIALALKLEKRVKEMDASVDRVGFCEVDTGKSRLELHNTLGLEAVSERTMSMMAVEPIVKRGDEEKNSFSWRMGTEPIDTDALAREAIDETLAQFDASPVEPGEYRILLRNSAAVDFLSVFSSVFSADEAQKGLSLFANREGEVVAAECVTVMDDPFYPGYRRAFDDEGVPGKEKAVIEKGVLKTLLHSLKTAKKAGVESTGNGSGSRVSPTNFYIAPGSADYESLVKKLGSGLVITEVTGLHAGVNAISGDFSLLARGFLVEGGKVVRAVDQITVAGSFFEMLKDVEEVGKDLKFSFPGGMARPGAPSVLVKKLTVAG